MASSGSHGEGRSRTHRSYRSPVWPTSARSPDPQIERLGHLPEEPLQVLHGLVAMLLTELVGHDPAGVSDRAAQGDRHGARPRPRLEHPRAGVDVRVGHDRPEVLRIDHLRAALHLQGVVGEARAERRHDHPARGLGPRALGVPDQQIVGQRAGVRVIGPGPLQHEQVRPAALVEQHDPLPRRHRLAHAAQASAGAAALRAAAPARSLRSGAREARWAAVARPASRRPSAGCRHDRS